MIEYKSISLANQVYEKLELNILSGVYKYGEIITENKLAEELGVSRTPIREALGRLAQDNLIADSSKGTVVLGITEKDINDIFCVKKRIEVMSITWACDNIDDEGLEKLKDILEQQEFYVTKHDASKIRLLDTDFHETLYDYSGSPIIKSILSPLHKKLLKFRQASLQYQSRMIESVDEHRAIYEALCEKDPKKVEECAKKHITNAGKNIQKGL